jgi:hypothetical protein
MEKKIICIFLCMPLIVASVFPVAGNMNVTETFIKESKDFDNSAQQISDHESSIMTNWLQQAKLTASDGAINDVFGCSVSIQGEYAAVGAYGDDSNRGSVYIFKRTGTSWTRTTKLSATDGETDSYFGCSVAIDGEYAIIGAYGDDNNMGSVYIYKRSAESWSQEAKLTASDSTIDSYFGCSVAIDGEYAVIGAYGDDSNMGSAYIFNRTGVSWSQVTKLTSLDGTSNDFFGSSVSIDGEYVVIGAKGDDDNGDKSGSAYVFKRTGTNWSQEDKLNALDGTANDVFGSSVSINGEYTIVGAYGDDSNMGSAYIFKRTGTSWSQEAKLTALDGETDDCFGNSVLIDGEYVVIGAFSDDNNMGSAYIFKRTATSWSEQAKLTASDGAANDDFGCSVSLDGEYVVIGAYHDDSWVGSAYVFNRGLVDCCIVIENVTGGLLDPSKSLYINAVIKNTGTEECNDITWSFDFSGGILLKGTNSGSESSILPGETVNISSNVIIGLTIFGLSPIKLTISADASNSICPPATVTRELRLFFFLLKMK